MTSIDLAYEFFKKGNFEFNESSLHKDIYIFCGKNFCYDCEYSKECDEVYTVDEQQTQNGALRKSQVEEFYQKYPEARIVS